MIADSLNLTVRELMQPTELLSMEDSIARAASVLRRTTGAFVPVVQDGRLLGAVTETRMAALLSDGCAQTDSVEKATDKCVLTVPPYVSGAEALQRLLDTGVPALIVVDDAGRVMGLVEASDLYPRPHFQPALGPVGGMATPFGVHLTTGVASAGVPQLALVSTGALMCALLVVSILVTEAIVLRMDTLRWAVRYAGAVNDVLPFALFLLGMRLLPISGIHAAEHKVVHALERGEQLTPDVVRRMPRVHPRCGTNLAVGATLFIGLATSRWLDEGTRLLVAGVVTLFFWQRLGTMLQYYATTKRPTDRQLAMGIRAGRELIVKYQHARTWVPTIWQRVWHSGMLHVIVGSTATYQLARWLLSLAGRPDLL
jgi:CBS domain-containing protein